MAKINEMRTPSYLHPNDKIGLVAPARKVSQDEIAHCLRTLEEWGLKPVLGENIYGEADQFSGTDEERTADFQQMLDDPEIKAILCARGGYGTLRIIDRLDFSNFVEKPKWIAGFSDATILHAHLNECLEIESIHSPMAINFKDDADTDNAIEAFRRVLFGESKGYEIGMHDLNRRGDASGILVGGNLSLLYALNGSVSDLNTDGKILFLEDLDEYLYHIDRMMQNLLRAGKLSNLAGLVVGGMTEMKDNKVPFGKTAEEIIRGVVDRFDYPVAFGFPAGHVKTNLALILGRKINFEVGLYTLITF